MSHSDKPFRKFFPAFFWVSLFLVSACGFNSSAPEGATVSTEESWYACTASSSGEGWDCGDNVTQEGPEEKTADTHSIEPATVTVTAISIETLDSEEDKLEKPEAEQKQAVMQEPVQFSPLYTLQLGAFAGEAQRERFIEDEGLNSENFDFRMVENQGRIWWVLTYGEYADTGLANQQRIRLEQSYGLTGVWLRSLEDFIDDEQFSKPPVKQAVSQVDKLVDSPESEYYDPRYSVQLAAFRTQERRNQYIQRQGLSAEALIFLQEERDTETWWILLYGEYISLDEAREAQAYLNEKYGITDTWVKPRY